MKLNYKAVTKDGKTQRGIIDAKDVNEAATYLRSKELLPIQIEAQDKFGKYLPFRKKVKNKDVVLFTRQLASTITAGITLSKSLDILKEQASSPPMVDVINALISDIQEGSSFSKAIEKHPSVFSPIYISIVKAGESSGLLDKVLLRLADNLEKQQKLRSTIKSALMYPAVVVTMMIVVVFIMMIFVMPQLAGLYKNLNVPLPLPTRIVIGFSNFVKTFWPIIFLVVGGLIYAFRRWRKTPDGRLATDHFTLRFPIFGKLIKQSILAEFSRTLGLLVGTGTSVVSSLLQTAEVANNKVYENSIKDIAKRVEKGVGIGDSMSVYPIFPQLLIQLTKIGEETGKLDETLLKASEYFENEVSQLVKTLTTAMEPFIMIVLGIGVAFLIISVITPIYSLVSSIQ
ncbi:MAG: type II secretion system F family protein [Patescibacteria group bacterium]